MRRKDREMNKSFGLEVIDNAKYGVLAVNDKENIYNIPLSIVRIDNNLYFHSAKEGRKVYLFENEKDVSLVFVTDVNIPENYSHDELKEFKKDETRTKELISNVFTTEFASAMVQGRVSLVEDEKLKISAMKKICEKYTPDKMEFFDLAIKTGLSRVNIYSISIDKISAKRKKYDSKAIEMKFGRME